MSVIKGFLFLLGFLLLGDVLATLFNLPISAGVLGMLCLTFWLLVRGRMQEDLQAVAQPLIGLLALLIMPGVVGVFFVAGDYLDQWLAIFLALVIGTCLSVFTTLVLMSKLTPTESKQETAEDIQS